MAKLYLRHNSMGAGKSVQLLNIAHDYESRNGHKILILKPVIDNRGEDCVTARLKLDGETKELKRKCDFLIKPHDNLYEIVGSMKEKPSIILIDESQFLSKENVQSLPYVVKKLDIPAICFGLRSDFQGKPFEGSSWLFAVAEDIEEVTTRALSQSGDNTKRATMNMRLVNGKPTFEGSQVAIDEKDKVTYKPVSLDEFVNARDEWLEQQRIINQIDYRGGGLNYDK